jgi:hypothetical protein
MSAREYCVYDETHENLLATRVTVLDAKAEPLQAVKALIEGLAPGAETGLWLNPLKSIPTVPRLSSYDLVYLDGQCRVLQAVALGADDDVPLFDGQAASALVLPIHSFSASQTHPGDRVILYAADESSSSTSSRVHFRGKALGDTAAASTAIAASQPAFPLASASADLDPVPVGPLDRPQLLPPIRIAKERAGIGLLRSIVHLRIHISISVTTAPPAISTGDLRFASEPISAALPLEKPHGQFATKSSLLRAGAASLAQRSARAVASAAAKTAGFLSPRFAACSWRCTIWKERYIRWAEVVVYGAPRLNSRGGNRAMCRAPRLEEEC